MWRNPCAQALSAGDAADRASVGRVAVRRAEWKNIGGRSGGHGVVEEAVGDAKIIAPDTMQITAERREGVI